MNSWRTNLGGALGSLGTALVAVGTLTQLSQLSPNTNVLTPHQLAALWYVALVGFIISGIGKFFTALFAADAKSLSASHQELSQKVATLETAVRTGDTSVITRDDVEPPVVAKPVAAP